MKIFKLLVFFLLLLCIAPCVRADNFDQKVFGLQIRYFIECRPYIDNFEETLAYIVVKNLEKQINKYASIEKTFYGYNHFFIPNSAIVKLDSEILKQKLGIISGIKYSNLNIQIALRRGLSEDKNKTSATFEAVLHF